MFFLARAGTELPVSQAHCLLSSCLTHNLAVSVHSCCSRNVDFGLSGPQFFTDYWLRETKLQAVAFGLHAG